MCRHFHAAFRLTSKSEQSLQRGGYERSLGTASKTNET